MTLVVVRPGTYILGKSLVEKILVSGFLPHYRKYNNSGSGKKKFEARNFNFKLRFIDIYHSCAVSVYIFI